LNINVWVKVNVQGLKIE